MLPLSDSGRPPAVTRSAERPGRLAGIAFALRWRMDRPLGAFLGGMPIVEWLSAHLYPVVFVGALVDASGVPFPGRLLLIAAGALTAAGHGHLSGVIAVTIIAAMTMDHAWYFAARANSARVLRLYRRMTGITDRRGGPGADYFGRYGMATIIVGRFSTTVRAVGWPLAAARGLGYVRFLMLDLVGATIWATLWVGLGWTMGARWKSAADAADAWIVAGTAVLLVIAAAPFAIQIWRRRRRNEEHAIPKQASGP
jgi:membrane protein DedA with SNARE-associated domain